MTEVATILFQKNYKLENKYITSYYIYISEHPYIRTSASELPFKNEARKSKPER